MQRELTLELVRVTEAAALAAARWMGRGDRKKADQAAVDAMRALFDTVDIKGTVVIGEGEIDEAPMLYIGEKVGTGRGLEVDVAVDPLEGTNLVALGLPNALAVVAAAPRGCMLHAPDMYMDKIAVGPASVGKVHLDASVAENLAAVAAAVGKRISQVTAIILDRPRHEHLVKAVRQAGARIRLISDGDVAAAIATSLPEAGIDIMFGSGGAPEGVLAAAALHCLGGEIQGRLMPRNEGERSRAAAMLGGSPERLLGMHDLVKSDVIFACTGITKGDMLEGVRYTAEGAVTQSLAMRAHTGTIRHIRAVHDPGRKPVLGPLLNDD